jgi:hypothetical protein
MGLSPSHRFGQIIGDVLEKAVEPVVSIQAKKHHLYLDKKGPRACRKGAKLSWSDVNGNTHDLDFVLERGGSDDIQGSPAAFIEVAWRRYTKHSRAKAQEIQGAIMPLLEKHHRSAPFLGAVLAGVFTEPSLAQLKSLGFTILYIPTASIVKVFSKFGIDADMDESTPDEEFQRQVDRYEALSSDQKNSLADALLNEHQEDVKVFSDALEKVLSRQIERIIILPLHGRLVEFATVDEALASITNFNQGSATSEFVRYEIEIRYNNGNNLKGSFQDKEAAIEFLTTYKPVVPTTL